MFTGLREYDSHVSFFIRVEFYRRQESLQFYFKKSGRRDNHTYYFLIRKYNSDLLFL